MKKFVNTLAKKLKTLSGIYGDFIEIPKIRKSQFCVLRSLELGKWLALVILQG